MVSEDFLPEPTMRQRSKLPKVPECSESSSRSSTNPLRVRAATTDSCRGSIGRHRPKPMTAEWSQGGEPTGINASASEFRGGVSLAARLGSLYREPQFDVIHYDPPTFGMAQ